MKFKSIPWEAWVGAVVLPVVIYKLENSAILQNLFINIGSSIFTLLESGGFGELWILYGTWVITWGIFALAGFFMGWGIHKLRR
jgi:hypothetical protein